jgi:hypothetical protein
MLACRAAAGGISGGRLSTPDLDDLSLTLPDIAVADFGEDAFGASGGF